MRRNVSIAFSSIVIGAIAMVLLFLLTFALVNWFKQMSNTIPKEVENFAKLCRNYCAEAQQRAGETGIDAIPLEELQGLYLCTKYVSTKNIGGYVEDHCYNDTAVALNPKKDYISIPCKVNIIISVGGNAYICNLADSTLLAKACKAPSGTDPCNYIFGTSCSSTPYCRRI